MAENKATFEKNGRPLAEVPDPEVLAQAKRRRFTAEYKQRILAEEVWINRPQQTILLPPDQTQANNPKPVFPAGAASPNDQPGAPAGSRVAEGQAQRALDPDPHPATLGLTLRQAQTDLFRP